MENPLTRPPNGGWGWMIVLGSFGVHMGVMGVLRSFGALYPLIQKRYGTSAAVTQWLGGLSSFLMLGLAPVATALSQRYSERSVVMTGSALVCVGLLTSAVCPDGKLLLLTYGLVTGIGFGLAFAPSNVIVGLYFDGRRSLATNIGISGAAIGNFVLPLLIGVFEEQLGFLGCFQLLAGISLQGCVFGALFVPLKKYNKYFVLNKLGNTSEMKQLVIRGEDKVYIERVSVQSLNQEKKHEKITKKLEKPSFVRKFVQKELQETRLTVSAECLSQKHKGTSTNDAFHKSDYELHDSRSPNLSRGALEITGELAQALSLQSLAVHSQSDRQGQLLENDNNTSKKKGPVTRGCTIFGILPVKFHANDPRPALFEFSLLREKVFILYCVTAFLGYLSLYIGLVVLIPFALDNDIPENTARLMLAVSGLINMVSRIAVGWFTDLKLVPVQTVYGGTMIIQGFLLLFQPLMKTTLTLWVFTIGFGLFGGSVISLNAVVMAEVMGIERLAGSFGVTVFFMASSVLFGPTVLGYVRDVTGSWDIPLVVVGVCSLLSGSLAVAEGILSWRRRKRQAKA